MQSNKLVFEPIEFNDPGDDDHFYEYNFQYNSNESKFDFDINLGRRHSREDDILIEQMKNNRNYAINGHIKNGEISISTEDGFTSFHLAKYDDVSSGSNSFSLKNELCIEAFEAWMKHWKENPK